MKRLRKDDDRDNKKAGACKRKQRSREGLHQQRKNEEQAQVHQHKYALEAARIERISLEDCSTRCSQDLAQHIQRIAHQTPQECAVINEIRTLQYNGPDPTTGDGLTSLQLQIKRYIVQVKAQ